MNNNLRIKVKRVLLDLSPKPLEIKWEQCTPIHLTNKKRRTLKEIVNSFIRRFYV